MKVLVCPRKLFADLDVPAFDNCDSLRHCVFVPRTARADVEAELCEASVRRAIRGAAPLSRALVAPMASLHGADMICGCLYVRGVRSWGGSMRREFIPKIRNVSSKAQAISNDANDAHYNARKSDALHNTDFRSTICFNYGMEYSW